MVGVRVVSQDDQTTGSSGIVCARTVVLASGGLGQLYASTTNPPVATGDGMAMALRAGADVADMEFVQFHPTVMWNGPGAEGQQLLVSEAVRGEGAVLLDADGRRVMQGRHPLGDLAPRDVVAKCMSILMAEQGVDHLFLDARGLGEKKLLHHFPNIVAGCRRLGIDPVQQVIPVAPGEHFACGGVWTDRNGHTSLPGLFAVGEVACTGVHGANRLASNSLLEGLVYGQRVGAQLVLGLPAVMSPDANDEHFPAVVVPGHQRVILAAEMSRHVAVRREAEGLDEVAAIIADTPAHRGEGSYSTSDWEATNVHVLAGALVSAARRREESRGGHWRSDFPDTSPRWKVRIVTHLNHEGSLVHEERGLEETP